MQSRNLQVRLLSWGSSLLLLVLLVTLNVVFARSASRIDMTEEGLYTLSEGSEAILGRLEDPVTIKVFWADVPARFDHTKRYVSALLEEMGAASGGQVQTTWVDMSSGDSGATEAKELRVQPYIFQAAHGKEVRQSEGYMSLVIEMGDEAPRTFDVLFQIQGQLEYLIVSTIYERARSTKPVVGFVSNKPFNPFGGGRQAGNFRNFEAALTQAFGSGARPNLDLAKPVPETVNVLVVARPRNLTEEQVYHFEQFLLRGGRGILLEDPADLENVLGRAAASGEPHASGFEDWLAHLGVTVERGAVADFKKPSGFPRGRAEFVRYPFWPQIQRSHMDPNNPVTRATPPMTLYWPAAISIDQAKQEVEGRKATVLARTTDGGYRRGDLTGLAQADESPTGKLLEEVPVVAMIEGPLKSFWLGKPLPGAKPAEESGSTGLPGGMPMPGAPPQPAAGDEGERDAGEGDPGKGDAEKKKDAAGSPDGDASGSPDGDAPLPPAGDDPKKADPEKKPDPKKPDPKKPDPKKPDPKKDDGDEEADASEAEGPERLETGTIRLIIMGDADFMDDRIISAPVTRVVNGNTGPTFVLSAAEWMSGSDELLALRARDTNPRSLDEIDEETESDIKTLNLGTIPLLAFLIGLTIFIVRRFT